LTKPEGDGIARERIEFRSTNVEARHILARPAQPHDGMRQHVRTIGKGEDKPIERSCAHQTAVGPHHPLSKLLRKPCIELGLAFPDESFLNREGDHCLLPESRELPSPHSVSPLVGVCPLTLRVLLAFA